MYFSTHKISLPFKQKEAVVSLTNRFLSHFYIFIINPIISYATNHENIYLFSVSIHRKH
nr:MAG TPA: hypothetical protein [Bacteriophage sp.]